MTGQTPGLGELVYGGIMIGAVLFGLWQTGQLHLIGDAIELYFALLDGM